MVKPSSFELRTELNTHHACIIVAGELDLSTAPRLEDEVQGALAHGAGEITIDLQRITFIDSSGLRLFIVLAERAAAEHWMLRLTSPAGRAAAIFDITGARANLPFVEEPRAP